MTREWTPGDVALVTAHWRSKGKPATSAAIRDDEGWYKADDMAYAFDRHVKAARPLVVIDPEDREQVARLADAFCIARWSHLPGSEECDPLTRSSMTEALRSLVEPPKPEEPTGKWSVILDAKGAEWIRAVGGNVAAPWLRDGSLTSGNWHDYRDIDAVRVLSEGVQS